MASPCPPRAARGALEFVLNPQPSSPPSHANTAQMQSPDHGPDEDALHDRLRTAKYAALKLAGKMTLRCDKLFSIVRGVLNVDDMSGWSLLRQAKEWEGKLELLTSMDADADHHAVHHAELPARLAAGGSPGAGVAEHPPIQPGGPTVQSNLPAISAPALPAVVVRGNGGGVRCKRRDRGRDSAPYDQEQGGATKRRRRLPDLDDPMRERRLAHSARQASGYARAPHVAFETLILKCGDAIRERLQDPDLPMPPRLHPRQGPKKRRKAAGERSKTAECEWADATDFWRTIVVASMVAQEKGFLPLNVTLLMNCYDHFYPGKKGHSHWLRPGRRGTLYTVIEVWTAAGIRLEGENYHEELVRVHLLPWWLSRAATVHKLLTDWIPTAPTGLAGDALLDAALREIRTKHTRWPNHGDTDRRCMAAVADPAALALKISQSQASVGYQIDWSAEMQAVTAHPDFKTERVEYDSSDVSASDSSGGGSLTVAAATTTA